jgi:hypothetical protein
VAGLEVALVAVLVLAAVPGLAADGLAVEVAVAAGLVGLAEPAQLGHSPTMQRTDPC